MIRDSELIDFLYDKINFIPDEMIPKETLSIAHELKKADVNRL